MKTLLWFLAVLVPAIVVHGGDASNEPDAGRILSRSGKGVCVAKVKNNEAISFVFFPGTNRVRPTSTLKADGIGFPSLAAAVAFVKQKLPGVSLLPVSRGDMIDDAKILLELSEAEAKALIEAAAATEKKKPNRPTEPMVPHGRDSP